jgi:hypothetical protein
MDKDMKEMLTDFEEAAYRHAYAGSYDPVTCNLIEIEYVEVKAKLYSAIEGLEEDLETALEEIDNMTDEKRRWEN